MSKEFAAMEEAALKAYEEDLKRLTAQSAGNRGNCYFSNVYYIGLLSKVTICVNFSCKVTLPLRYFFSPGKDSFSPCWCLESV